MDILANDTCPADFIREKLEIQTNVIDASYRTGAIGWLLIILRRRVTLQAGEKTSFDAGRMKIPRSPMYCDTVAIAAGTLVLQEFPWYSSADKGIVLSQKACIYG